MAIRTPGASGPGASLSSTASIPAARRPALRLGSELVEARAHSDLRGGDVHGEPLAHALDEPGEFSLFGQVAEDAGAGSVQERHVPGQSAVRTVPRKVLNGLARQHSPGPPQDLFRIPVVDAQPEAAPHHSDAERGEGHPGVVDPLVGIAREEDVVRPFGHRGPQQTPLGRVEVLCLVHDKVPVETGPLAPFPQDAGCLGTQEQVRAAPLRVELLDEVRYRPPHKRPPGRGQRAAPAAPVSGDVLRFGPDVLSEDDVPVLLHQELAGPRQAQLLGDPPPARPLVVVVDRCF